MSSAKKNSRRPGRPPGFDPQAVVLGAQRVFWSTGLAGTSYDELTLATGLHRPSICAAFGDKRGLFREAFRRYLQDSHGMVREALSRSDLAGALASFFEADVEVFTSQGLRRGCFALGVGAEAGRGDPELAEMERRAWRSLNDAIADRLAKSADEELPSGLDRVILQDLIVATHVALATRARAGETGDRLRSRARRFCALFPQGAHR